MRFLLSFFCFFGRIIIVFDTNLIQGFNGLAGIIFAAISRGKLVAIVITGTWMLNL